MRLMLSRIIALALLGTLGFAFGCGGTSGSTAIVLQSITISPTSQTVSLSQQQPYSAQCGFSDGPGACPTLSWNSSDTNVATINSSGLASASNSNTGSTFISASATGVSSNMATLTVQSGAAAQNSVALTVDGGPAGIGGIYPDAAFASVTVCVPGTANCQTIDHVLVDTGSYGLRILKSGSAALTLPLAQESTFVECAQFVSSFTWGPVMLADVKMAGEVASNVPIQVIGDSSTNAGFPDIPNACQTSVVCPSPPCSADTLQTLGANGLLGVGSFIQDCGPACVSSTAPGFYYSCPTATTCAGTTVPLAQQVANPVATFASDNNGVLVQLQSIASGSGQASAAGTMFFGIGTQSNNALGSATIFQVDEFGDFTTVYPVNGPSYPGSFLDSGSNGIFFLTTALTGMSDSNCGGTNGAWYCPANPTGFTTITEGTTGTSETVDFNAENVNLLFSGDNAAFNDLTGPNPTCFVNATTTGPCFDWGLAFFFGRNVFTAIEGQPTPAGPGPYWAY